MLDVKNLKAGYGATSVLHGVNLEIGAGEIVSIVGRNGSGRSTLMKALLAIVPPSHGDVTLSGRPINGLKTFEIVRSGLSYVPEDRLVFHNLTVAENLALGVQKRPGAKSTWNNEDFWDLFPNLASRRDTKAGVLSGGEQQMLTMCRSLLSNPDIILVDEPTEGLAPKIVEAVVKLLLEMKRRGLGVALVEQKLTVALEISDRIYVMGHGEIVFDGTPADLRARADIRHQWLEV